MVIDLYPGFVFDGIDQAKYDASSLSTNSHYPTYPQFDHHKFIDSTVGDVLIAGIQNPDGILTVDKLLVTKKNIDMSPSGWFHTESGKSFVICLSFDQVGRGFQRYSLHRTALPPAEKITLITMSIEGDTIMDDGMILGVGADFYVGGGSSTTASLTYINKSAAGSRCDGVTYLNKDVTVILPSSCIALELYMSQVNTMGSELNKKITLLIRVYSG